MLKEIYIETNLEWNLPYESILTIENFKLNQSPLMEIT